MTENNPQKEFKKSASNIPRELTPKPSEQPQKPQTPPKETEPN